MCLLPSSPSSSWFSQPRTITPSPEKGWIDSASSSVSPPTQELIPLILCTACLHPEPKERDQLLHILFNLIKRPDDEQRYEGFFLFFLHQAQCRVLRSSSVLFPKGKWSWRGAWHSPGTSAPRVWRPSFFLNAGSRYGAQPCRWSLFAGRGRHRFFPVASSGSTPAHYFLPSVSSTSFLFFSSSFWMILPVFLCLNI